MEQINEECFGRSGKSKGNSEEKLSESQLEALKCIETPIYEEDCETPDADEMTQQLALANINFFPNPQSLMVAREPESEREASRKKIDNPEESMASQSTLEGSELRKTQSVNNSNAQKQSPMPASEYWECSNKPKPPLPPASTTNNPGPQIQKCRKHPKKKVR